MIGTEQFSAWNKANVDGALDFARLSLQTTERLVALNLEASRAVLADVAKSTQGFEVKDLQDVGALRNRVAEAGWNKVSAYSKAAYDVLASAQAELASAFEHRVADLHHQSAAAIEKAAKAAPAGTEPFIALMKSGLAASASAFDTATKATRQLSHLAESSMKAAAANVTPKTGKK
jgi:phasin family protein